MINIFPFCNHRYLSIPASSASCERLWSWARDLLKSKRSRFLPERASKILFLLFNIELLTAELEKILNKS